MSELLLFFIFFTVMALAIKTYRAYRASAWLKGNINVRRQVSFPGSGFQFLRSLIWVVVALLLYGSVSFSPFTENTGPDTETASKGVDILFIIDVSLSMKAVDASPDRITAVKDILLRSLPVLAGNRFGIIVFAGSAFLYSPMTSDISVVSDFIRGLDADMVADRGTNLEEGFVLAGKVLSSDRILRNRLLVVITDGENFKGNPVAPEAEIVFAGIGSEAPIYFRQGGISGYVREDGRLTADRNEKGVIVSKAGHKWLQEQADKMNASYVNLGQGDFGKLLLSKTASMEKNMYTRIMSGRQGTDVWFISLALFIMFFDLIVMELWLKSRLQR